ncbi:MAG: glycoside hydrolase [Chloroflexi bacterium]|nr:glycoside hydrolase [Chloroflexota bacterium]
MSYPLYVAFVWHQHQPYYLDPVSGEYSLPWVRLHATKDYLHMLEVLQAYPTIHQTINLVPSLIEQLDDYATGRRQDQCQRISRTPVEQLTPRDRAFVLSFFFSINWHRVLCQYPRYQQLLQLRHDTGGDASVWSDADLRDLIAYFNLAWIDPNWLERDEVLRRLVEKERDFSPADVQAILDKHQEILRRVLPAHRELQDRGQIEISASPYYHPILPLLIDSRSAREASPHLPLPDTIYAHPEDAAEQIRRGQALYQATFGRPCRGLWPSEGAVSQSAIELIAGERLRWCASDEDILARSLGVGIYRDEYAHVTNPWVLYQPYRCHTVAGDIDIVFRDHVLSDRIGFVYAHVNGHDAAGDLIHRLNRIRENLNDPGNPYLVSIILDGENCWEEYEHNGDVFLHALYRGLAQDPNLQTVTVSEYLDRFAPRQEILRVAAGSWIGGNMETWIGEPLQNRGWELLARTRQHLLDWQVTYPLADLQTLAEAWQSLYVAQGSDWFWWYYSRNTSNEDALFDRLFRDHLGHVFQVMGQAVPDWLGIQAPAAEADRSIRGPITPELRAADTASPAWGPAGYCGAGGSGTMQRAQTGPRLRGVYYGYGPQNLYVRIETSGEIWRDLVGLYWHTGEAGGPANTQVRFAGTRPDLAPAHAVLYQWELVVPAYDEGPALNRADGNDYWHRTDHAPAVARGHNSAEVRIPRQVLELRPGDRVGLRVTLARDGQLTDVLPLVTDIEFTVP